VSAAAARRVLLAAALLLAAGPAAAGTDPLFGPLPHGPGAPALRVYLVRHAQAWKNVPAASRPHPMSAEELDGLTPSGFARSERVGARLAKAGIARVLCSPARRARQTAETIARVLRLGPPTADDAFRPIDFGTDPRGADFRWRTTQWKAGHDPRPPGGESLGDGLERAVAAFDTLAKEEAGTSLVVVTHGEIASALVSHAAGVPPLTSYGRSFVGEGTITIIDIGRSGRWTLVARSLRP
jgi:broad specificity phosphatase PhoE